MTKAAELAKMGEVLTNSQIGGRRNIMINGAMNIAQRSTSLTGQGAYPGGYLTVDRWKFVTNNSAGRFTVTQEAITDLPGFLNCTKLDCTTADTSIASGEYLMFSQYFEGQDVQQLKKGTSEAEKFTLSFYVKGNANATYTAEFSDVDNTRHNAQEFSVTTSWNRVSLTYNGDTTGALDDDSNVSFRLFIWLHAGSDYTGGTFSSNTWQATNNQRVSDNQTSFYDSTDRTFFITGVQLEIGSQATPFEHRSFGEEMALCQRYYTVIADGSYASGQSAFGMGAMYGTTVAYGAVDLPTEMRANPTVESTDATNYMVFYRAGAGDLLDEVAFSISQPNRVEFFNQTDISGTSGHAGFFRLNSTSARLAATAEL